MQGGELARLNLVSNLRNWLILNSSISGGLIVDSPGVTGHFKSGLIVICAEASGHAEQRPGPSWLIFMTGGFWKPTRDLRIQCGILKISVGFRKPTRDSKIQ